VRNVAFDYYRREVGSKGDRRKASWEDADKDGRLEAELAQGLATIHGLTTNNVRILLDQTELEPRERSVVEYTYWYGLTSEEIAQVLGSSASTVRTWLSNAKCKLRAQAGEG